MEASDEPGYSDVLQACDDSCLARTAAMRECLPVVGMEAANPAAAASARTLTARSAAPPPGGALLAFLSPAAPMEASNEPVYPEFLRACVYGCPERITAAVRAGCDTAARDNTGRTGLMLAVMSSGDTAAAALQAVLALGAAGRVEPRLEARDDCGRTAFLHACFKGSVDCITVLAAAGCDTAARSSNDQTALMLAAASRSDSAAAVQAVIALGTDGLEDKDDYGSTAFLHACFTGNVECIAALAAAGCDKAARNSKDQTALMLAASCSSASAAAVQTVLALGEVGVEKKDDTGSTAFLHACSKCSVGCIVALAEAGCDKQARTSKGLSGLMIAVMSSSASATAVQTLLALGAAGLEDMDDCGSKAFIYACFKGSVECITALAAAGCDQEARTTTGQTGLMLAASSGSASAAAVQTLLALGAAGLDEKDDDGCTAFLHACSKGSAQCIVALAEAGCDKAARATRGDTGLMLAAASGSASATAVQAVLALGEAGLEKKDDTGCTAFLRACSKGSAQCIVALVEAGCDKQARAIRGKTGLMLAAGSSSGSATAVQTLLALGAAGLDEKDDEHRTAFLCACSKGSVQRITALAAAGCDQEARTTIGQTGLMLAASSGSASAAAVQTLLALGAAGLDEKDDDGCTAFLHACPKGSAQCIVALAEAGCDTRTTDIHSMTGLMLAAASNSGVAVQAVLALGAAGLEDKDDCGATALMHACTNHSADCIVALVEAGCDTETINEGITAFLLACFHGDVNCITALADVGCDTAARSITGQTGLMLAARSIWDMAGAVQAVLALGRTELDATDDAGRTAFVLACGAGNIECIMALAHAGCDTFIRSERTSVNVEGYAQSAGHEQVLPSIASAHLIQRAREARELAADATLAGYDRAMAHLEQAIKQHGGSPESTELLDELWEQRKQQHELAVRKAQQAEAELLAMIEGGPSVAAADAKAAEKARRKTEKRQRQKMARAPAAAAAAVGASAVAQTDPPPEPSTAELLADTDAAKARKKKAKRLRQQERKAAARRAAEGSAASGTQTYLPTPLALAQETVPMPELRKLERPTLVELSQQPEEAQQIRGLSPAADEPALPPLAQLTVEQSVAWLGTVSGLAPDAIEAAGRSFTANEIDGEELETIRPKLLRSILKGCLPEAKARDAAIAAILGRRDEQLVEESTPEDSMVCSLSLCLMEDPWTTQVGSTCE
jgi:ankyrin repeat protein